MIDLNNVRKCYGKTAAIDGITLGLRDNKIYCLLGRNGAGKTTLMKLIAGKISATSGEISVGGCTVSTINMPENVRYIEAARPQFNMSVIGLFSLAAGVDSHFDMNFALRMAEKFNLNKKKKYNALSFGMKTMVTTIISLASNDDIILLDEPVLGFDAVMRSEFYSLLSESFAAHPRIIVISTHLIDEIAQTAEQIIAIDNGKLIFNEDINTVTERSYKITGLADEVKLATRNLNVLDTENIGKYSVAYVYDKRIDCTDSLEISDLHLQELFVKMTGGKQND